MSSDRSAGRDRARNAVAKPRRLLLAFDLEEFYGIDGRPAATATPLPNLVAPLLQLLEALGVQATFFAVGDVARDHPDLLRRIAAAGHEIGCHGDHHIPLDQLNPEQFAADLQRNLDAIDALGLDAPAGFRAPLLSLDAERAWAHAVMRRLGLSYSSSVLPAASPLYGWPEFGPEPRRKDGVWEIPVPVGSIGPWRFPCFAGTYFRVLPLFLTRRMMRATAASGLAVGGYLHPYDFDAAQPWTWHAQLAGRLLMNHLLFVRRGSVSRRLRRILEDGWNVSPYGRYVEALAAAAAGPSGDDELPA